MHKAIAFVCAGMLLVAGCGKKKQPVDTTSELTPPPPPTVLTPESYSMPVPAPAPHAVTPAPAPAPAPTPKAEVKTTPAAKPAPKPVAKASKVYVVKKGDVLSRIAVQHKTTVAKILELNPKLNPDKIMVGQKINLP